MRALKISLLVVALLPFASPANAQDQLREKLDAIYGRGGYQRELPVQDDIEARRGKATGESYEHRRPPERKSAEIPEWLSRLFASLTMALPWIALAAALALVAAIVRRSRRRAPARTAASPQEAPGFAMEPARAGDLPDAEALAREGRFAEAVHALLLAAIDRIRNSASRALSPSLTSRELSATLALAPGTRAALARLVRAVEVTLFGGRQAGPAEYAACAADFQEIEGPR
jgi:hypothetical protein